MYGMIQKVGNEKRTVDKKARPYGKKECKGGGEGFFRLKNTRPYGETAL